MPYLLTKNRSARQISARSRISLLEKFADNEEWLALIDEAVYQYQKKTVRKMILKDHKRPDGRAINEIRPLAAEVDLIPRVHGSAMFTRGQTQICTITTLAPLSEAQKIDGLDVAETSKRYMHHYNFPSYSVGETKPSRGPGRREIGHGALAERALVPVLPSEEEFPYAIRTVSETFESNGSTSQASICASTMSLMAAGVPIKTAVAGISCGLVTGETDDDYIVLTDIQGLEDFFGDMDFKVAGTHKGYHRDPDGYQDPRSDTPDHRGSDRKNKRSAPLYPRRSDGKDHRRAENGAFRVCAEDHPDQD